VLLKVGIFLMGVFQIEEEIAMEKNVADLDQE